MIRLACTSPVQAHNLPPSAAVPSSRGIGSTACAHSNLAFMWHKRQPDQDSLPAHSNLAFMWQKRQPDQDSLPAHSNLACTSPGTSAQPRPCRCSPTPFFATPLQGDERKRRCMGAGGLRQSLCCRQHSPTCAAGERVAPVRLLLHCIRHALRRWPDGGHRSGWRLVIHIIQLRKWKRATQAFLFNRRGTTRIPHHTAAHAEERSCPIGLQQQCSTHRAQLDLPWQQTCGTYSPGTWTSACSSSLVHLRSPTLPCALCYPCLELKSGSGRTCGTYTPGTWASASSSSRRSGTPLGPASCRLASMSRSVKAASSSSPSPAARKETATWCV